jgi:hypothetical protein
VHRPVQRVLQLREGDTGGCAGALTRGRAPAAGCRLLRRLQHPRARAQRQARRQQVQEALGRLGLVVEQDAVVGEHRDANLAGSGFGFGFSVRGTGAPSTLRVSQKREELS